VIDVTGALTAAVSEAEAPTSARPPGGAVVVRKPLLLSITLLVRPRVITKESPAATSKAAATAATITGRFRSVDRRGYLPDIAAPMAVFNLSAC